MQIWMFMSFASEQWNFIPFRKLSLLSFRHLMSVMCWQATGGKSLLKNILSGQIKTVQTYGKCLLPIIRSHGLFIIFSFNSLKQHIQSYVFNRENTSEKGTCYFFHYYNYFFLLSPSDLFQQLCTLIMHNLHTIELSLDVWLILYRTRLISVWAQPLEGRSVYLLKKQSDLWLCICETENGYHV